MCLYDAAYKGSRSTIGADDDEIFYCVFNNFSDFEAANLQNPGSAPGMYFTVQTTIFKPLHKRLPATL